MKSLIMMLGITAVAGLLTLGWLEQVNDLQTAEEKFHLKTLLTEQGGYILPPPELVAPPFIQRIEWSPDGSYAVLRQVIPQLDSEEGLEAQSRVLIWSRKTKHLSVAWVSSKTHVHEFTETLAQVAFFTDTPACVFTVKEDERVERGEEIWYSVYYATPGGRVVKLGRFKEAFVLAPPEDAARYLVWSVDDPATPKQELAYAPILAGGRLGATRPVLPQISPQVRYHGLDSSSYWHADGKRLMVSYMVKDALYDDEGKEIAHPEYQSLLWNPRTNGVQPIKEEEAQAIWFGEQGYQHSQAAKPSVKYARTRVQSAGMCGRTETAWLMEGEQGTLLAAESNLVEVSPQGDALLYVVHGAAFFRPLIRLDAEQARTLKERLEKARHMRNAKQIANALLMYAQDYDELFPPRFDDEFVALALSPYIKDEEVFQVNGAFAFRYLLDGQSLANIESPAETVAGHLELPDGRAVIFADGHVRWEPRR
ncbi:MAG: hypothetical protein N2554_08310 [Fimbriimonadales bacterium]|nr:hypothetical protein [Fimbriimonadales bacterium]